MTTKTIILSTTLVGLLALVGCPKHQPPQVPVGPCDPELARIESATYDDAAKEAIRGFLTCYEQNATPPPTGLKIEVMEAIEANPYPAVRRAADAIVDWFFERKSLKDLPGNDAELELYLEMADDQALSARAEGDMKLAKAIQGQIERLKKLQSQLAKLRR